MFCRKPGFRVSILMYISPRSTSYHLRYYIIPRKVGRFRPLRPAAQVNSFVAHVSSIARPAAPDGVRQLRLPRRCCSYRLLKLRARPLPSLCLRPDAFIWHYVVPSSVAADAQLGWTPPAMPQKQLSQSSHLLGSRSSSYTTEKAGGGVMWMGVLRCVVR
jgi:hypothetical protein